MAEPVALRTYAAAAARAALVLAHGAGAGQASPFVVRVARALADAGVSVATFDFPYMAARRRVPDRAPVLESAWRDAIAAARQAFGPLPLFIGGKSMGGRIASHVAAQGGAGAIAGLVFFGYPLHPPDRPEARRDAHLPQIGEPMLFIQGTRDPFGTADEIRALLPSLRDAALHEIPGGDHSFKTPAAAGSAARDGVGEAIAAAAAWVVQRATSRDDASA